MKKNYEVVIIGCGFAGIASAINLMKMGFQDFVILERDEELGGTWWRNSYPGAAVDVQSQLYSFSFKTYNWSRLFAYQPEILEYTKELITEFKIDKKAIKNVQVNGLVFDDELMVWKIRTETGEDYHAKIVINATGILSQPYIPNFEGLSEFKRKQMHSSYWDNAYDVSGKKVAVIGSGASSVQICPAIAEEVKHLYIFQRSAHWIMPRPDRKLTSFERWINSKVNLLNKLYRKYMYWKLEARVLAFSKFPFFMKIGPQREAKAHIKKRVRDPKMREKLVPDYTIGCKRILLSNDYYPMLNRSNVSLFTKESGIKRFHETGVDTIDGKTIEVDCVVFATGFKASENNIVFPVSGKNGKKLSDEWSDHAHAYLGSAIPGFPNLFMLAGPNTGTGHTSAIYMIEAQLEYIKRAVKRILKGEVKSIEIKKEVEDSYNKRLQSALKNTVWQSGGCKSWYQDGEGVNTVIWPDYTFRFRKLCKKFREEDHILVN